MRFKSEGKSARKLMMSTVSVHHEIEPQDGTLVIVLSIGY